MITEITGSTTINEICELIKYIEKIEEKKSVWVEIYSDMSGGFYNHENGEHITIVKFENLKEYICFLIRMIVAKNTILKK